MALERSEGVLCLVGGQTPQALAEAIDRLLDFIARSRGLRLIDLVYTATCDARGKHCVAGLWVASVEEMARKLRFAREALRSGRTRTRDKSGVFFTTRPLALNGGKLAFVFPGTGSFHLEMMRDLALTFDGVRERFDDMEEAFSGFCDVASPSEWLFSTSPEHTLKLSASQAFLPLLASASTYLASKVFADLLKSVGVRPDAVGGVGLGAFSAFHATHHDPKFRLVQILRDAGRMLLRLGKDGDRAKWMQLTVSGIDVARLRELALRDPARVVLTQVLTDDDCVMAVAPEKRAEVEVAIHNGGGVSVYEPLAAPFNTGHVDAQMGRRLRDFFVKYVNCEPQIPFYSCVDGGPMGRSTSAVVAGLMDQMLEPLDFRAMIRRMYDDGCRLFVEVGARGLLSPLIGKVLAGRAPVAVIPMHILHRAGGVQVGQALGLLAANGVDIDYSGLRFFTHARRLDLSAPYVEEDADTLTVHLSRVLPAIRPELIDAQRVLGVEAAAPVETTAATHLHTLPANMPVGGLESPLLLGAQEIDSADGALALRCVLHLADFPGLNDYAIGSSNISLRDPQVRGLTLLSVPSALEMMAEVAHRLFPDLSLRRIETLRAPHWLAFSFGRLALRLHAKVLPAAAPSGNRVVAVSLCEDRGEDDRAVAMKAHFVLGPSIPEPPEHIDVQPLAAPTDVGWKADDIYPARLFQGPLLRNVRRVLGWGLNGLDYEIRIPSRAALVRRSRNPLFCALPLLLDAVVSGFPLWRSHERFHGAISLPFRCKAIRYYAAWVPEGTRLQCSLRLTNVSARTLTVDILVSDASGHPVLHVQGWEEAGGRAGQTLRDFVMNPAHYFITQPLPDSILPKGNARGAAKQIVGALYVNANPEFFVNNAGLWLDALAAAVLTPTEREDFVRMGGAPLRRLEWLLGRTAAKEAVRRLLLDNFRVLEPSADIAVWKDELGKPHPLGDWLQQIASPIDLSIAHTGGLIIGGATTVGHLGFDVESTSRDLTEDFLRGAFTLEEQELATRSGDGPIAILRFWCAKEAISKALGTGIRFAATDLRVRAADPATGQLGLELLGAWAENFPNLRGKRIPIKTSVLYDHVIACCHLLER